jgi:hypothetical protein
MLVAATVVAAVCATLGARAGTRPAAAGTYLYCGVVINSGTWCGNSQAFFGYNEAHYPGAGSVSVCQHLVNLSNGSIRAGSSCATNTASANYSTSVFSEAEVTHFSGATSHTVDGTAFD